MGTQAPGQTPPNQSNIQASGMLGGSGIPTPGAIAQPQPMQTGGSPAQGGKPGGAPSGQNNGINPQSGLPWGQHPGMGGAGNPFAPPTPDPFAQVPGGYRPPGAPPPNMYPGMNAPNQNRWGPGSSAGPGIPGPYEKIDPNTYLTKRPEGFNTFLGDTAAKNMIAPHERTAQSYGESYSRTPPPPKRKKGGK